jgi:6-phosphogluconolactonase
MTGKLDGPIAIQNHLQYVNNQCGDIAPHPHSIVPDTNNRYLLAADLGLDMICIYTLSLNNQKSFLHLHNFVKTQKNTGPRHISFHPSGKAVYVVGERSNTIETFQYDQVAGSLTFFSRHPLIPRSFSGNNTPADIQISPDGRYIYCSNRGNESITVFQTGKTPWELKYTQRFSVHGKNPRGICISRDGKFLFSANQDTHAIVCFKRDFASGVLSNPIAETQVKSPTSISIL